MTINVNETLQDDAAPSNGTEEPKRAFLTFPAILKIVCLVKIKIKNLPKFGI